MAFRGLLKDPGEVAMIRMARRAAPAAKKKKKK
jgi:hypothetical protein